MSDKNAAISLSRKYKAFATKVRARVAKLSERDEKFDINKKGPIRSGADLALFEIQKKAYERLATDSDSVARGLRLGLVGVSGAQTRLVTYERELKQYEQQRKDATDSRP